MEAGKRRLVGDTARAATTDEVKDLRRETSDLKEVVAEQTLERHLLTKAWHAPSADCLAFTCRATGYDRYLQRGEVGLQDQFPKPKRVWNRIHCPAVDTQYQ